MKRLFLVVVVALVSVGSAVAGVTTVVPVAAQQAASARSPQLAYIPTRAPSGYRYLRWRWDENASALRLWFRNRAGDELVYTATWQYGACARTTAHRAARCVSAAGVRIQLTAAAARVPTAGLARVVASARLVHFR
jgi:hypothetical protein